VIYTIGHSTRSADEFLALLQAHGVTHLADIRSFPASRRHPQFNRDALASFLASHGIVYRHMPALGGRRRPLPDSINSGWKHASFRGYADYMGTTPFEAAVDELERFAGAGQTSVMCAEAVWWRCHRRLLADALLVRGTPVRHIVSAAAAKPHALSEFARVSGRHVTYPALL
jgi:uncharacterized protein (DUF488 family)